MSAMMLVKRENSTLILTLSWTSPDDAGLLETSLVESGVEQLTLAERDDSIRNVIIEGSPQHFCRGHKLANLLDETKQAQIERDIKLFQSWVETINNYPKPVIAAVEGGAHDAGFSLALACDYVIASQSAQFSTSQIRYGLPPDGGISWHLSHQLPRQLVSELLLEGKPILAARLQQFGMLNQVVEVGKVLSTALRYARKLAELPPFAIERVKNLISEAPSNTLHQQLLAEQHMFLECLHHHEAQTGIIAYTTQSKPRF